MIGSQRVWTPGELLGRTMRLHAWIAAILLHRGAAAKDQAARAACEHRGPDVAKAGIDRDRLLGDAGLVERLRHAIGRPRLLRSRLEHQADLHRNDRQPQRVDTWGVAWQYHAQDRRLRLIANRHAALFHAVAS